MLLDALVRLALDAGAMGVLAFALYYRRHSRSDLAVLLCLFNLGVFLAVVVIVGGEFGLSAGLGLFAVLSVMRMRSETFSSRELGYLFTALALAIVCRPAPQRLAPALDVAFTRTTLVAPDRNERLSVDVELRVAAPGGTASGRLRPHLAIVESKSAGGLPLAVRELNALGARPLEGMSKYCLGVVLALGRGRGNALLPVLRQCDRPRPPV